MKPIQEREVHCTLNRKTAARLAACFLAASVITGCSGEKTASIHKSHAPQAVAQAGTVEGVDEFGSLLKKGDVDGIRKIVSNTDYDSYGFYGLMPGERIAMAYPNEKMTQYVRDHAKETWYGDWCRITKREKAGKGRYLLTISQKRYQDMTDTISESLNTSILKYAQDKKATTADAEYHFRKEIISEMDAKVQSLGSDTYQVFFWKKDGKFRIRRVEQGSDIEKNVDRIGLTKAPAWIYGRSQLGRNALTAESPETKQEFDSGRYLVDYAIIQNGQTVDGSPDFSRNATVRMLIGVMPGRGGKMTIALRNTDNMEIAKKEVDLKEGGQTVDMDVNLMDAAEDGYAKVTIQESSTYHGDDTDRWFGYIEMTDGTLE